MWRCAATAPATTAPFWPVATTDVTMRSGLAPAGDVVPATTMVSAARLDDVFVSGRDARHRRCWLRQNRSGEDRSCNDGCCHDQFAHGVSFWSLFVIHERNNPDVAIRFHTFIWRRNAKAAQKFWTAHTLCLHTGVQRNGARPKLLEVDGR